MTNRDHDLYWLLAKKPSPPLFTQAMVLELAPNISAATLQNWANREIVQAIIKGGEVRGRRYYEAMPLLAIVVGSQLVDKFQISPPVAVLNVLAASAAVMMQWQEDAVKGATHDHEKMPIEADWIKEYWAIWPGTATRMAAAKLSDLAGRVDALGDSLIWPHGRYMADVATKARKIYNRGTA